MLCIKLHPLTSKMHPLKSKMHPPLNRNCTPLPGFYQNYGSLPEKKQPLSTRQRLFLFNEINPFEICEMHFVREIAEVVGGFHFTFCANRKFRND